MDKDMQVDSDLEADAASSGFIFSRPNIVPSPEKTVNFGGFSDNVFGSKVAQQNELAMFTFAKPDTIETIDHMEDADIAAGNSNTSSTNLRTNSTHQNIKEANIFSKDVEINNSKKSLLTTQDTPTNVFAKAVKSSEDVAFSFSAPLTQPANIFSTSSSENYKAPASGQEEEKSIFSASIKPSQDQKSIFAVQSDKPMNVFSTTAKLNSETRNTENTNIFAKTANANEVHASPFAVQSTEKTDIFSVPVKPSDNFQSPFSVQESDVFTKSEESRTNQKSPFSSKESDKKSKAVLKSPPRSSGAKLKTHDRRSKSTESDSSFTASDLKKSEIFNRLEKNTKKNLDVKLELSRSITCSEVPDSLLVKAEAKKYFEKFGETLKIVIKTKRKMIIVYYATDNGALKAYTKAGTFDEQEFKTDWTTQEMLAPKPKKKESIKKRITSFLNIDDETKEELEALAHQPEYNLPNQKTVMDKAKLKKTRELTTKALTQKRIPPLMTKSLVKARTTALKPSVAVQERKVPRKEEAPVAVEAPVDNKVVLKISLAAIEELQNTIRQAGTTAEERYKILDARDRLMRLKRQKQKQKSLATATVTKGTCPDMCPEKERYMREFQRQVFNYEQTRDSEEYRIDHQLAVKQYSRSSADQEEPMPHDLRPVSSLKLAMSYLLHEIADLCEEEDTSLEDWYHFLWDRMRSIRKDITQQELCCRDTVELVEQCARFHILASERLCAEGASVFDPKINSENLTKCLQSLKYMYDDLREDEIACPHEAEFRAYIVLLNLNNGSFISELRTLVPEVQRSPEVKFALDVHSAMDMNNYSRFFKLVRSTSYLNACILLRYFNQVRVRALSTMVKAYCRTTGVTEYPLYELIDILGFEDEDEVFEFCQRVGLKCDKESLYIKLKRESFHEPDSNLEQNRAYNLVLSKRLSSNQSVGECIAGGKWPEKLYVDHQPHDSFDAQGYLLKRAINAQDQELHDAYEFKEEDDEQFSFAAVERKVTNNADVRKPANESKPAITPFAFKKPEAPPMTTIPKQLVTTATPVMSTIAKSNPTNIFASASNTTTNASTIFGKVDQPSSVFSAFKPASSLPTISAFNTAVNTSIFSGNSGPQTNLFKPTSAPPAVILPEQKNKHEIPSSTSERTSTKRTLEKTNDDDDEDIASMKKALTEKHELLKKKLEAELRLKAERERMELLETISANSLREYSELEAEVIDEICSSMVEAELDRLALIDRLSERTYEAMVNELCEGIIDEQLFVQDMLIEVDRRLRDRLLLKYCRAWKQWAARRRAHRREALDNTPVWLQPVSLEECAKKLYSPQQKIAIKYAIESRKRKSLESLESLEQRPKVKHAPIEFIVNVGLKENAKSFEVEINQHSFWKMVVSWPLLENRLTVWRHKKTVNKYLSPSDFTQEPIFIEHKPGPNERLDICIRYFEGLICENCLTGMDALLFVVFGDEDERSIQHRLTKTILGRGKLPPIPLVIIVFGDDKVDPHRIQVSAVLETVLESGHVSEYTILHEKSLDEDVVLRVFQSASLWLAINRSPAVPLEMDHLKRVFEDCLTEELWLRIQGHLSHDSRFSVPLNDPNFIINLHNEAVNYITDIIMDNESMSYTDFAPELKIYLENKQPYPCTYEYFDPVWKQSEYRAELIRIMTTFILPPWKCEWPIRDMVELHNAIARYSRQLLGHENSLVIASNIMSDLFLIAGYDENRPPKFSDVLLHIMEKMISDIPGNTRVVYNKNHVKHFQTLPWWFKSNALVEYMANVETDMPDDSDNPVVQEIIASTSQMDLDFECDIEELNETCIQQNEEFPISAVCEETRNEISEVQSITELLDKQLEEQKLKNEEFEAKLKAALEEDYFSDGS